MIEDSIPGLEFNGHMTMVSIDLETLGTKPNSPVLSIGATAYNLESGIFAVFEAFFDLDEQFKLGRVPSHDTFLWWLQQSEEARMDVVGRKFKSVETIEAAFNDWWASVAATVKPDSMYVSSNGNDFDLPILDTLFKDPIFNKGKNFRRKICWRGLAILYRGEFEYPKDEIRHSASGDAISQAKAHLMLMEKYPQRLSWIKSNGNHSSVS